MPPRYAAILEHALIRKFKLLFSNFWWAEKSPGTHIQILPGPTAGSLANWNPWVSDAGLPVRNTDLMNSYTYQLPIGSNFFTVL